MSNREIIFQVIPDGLDYHDTSDRTSNVLLMNMVADNEEGFNDHDIVGDRGSHCDVFGSLVLPWSAASGHGILYYD